MPSLPIKYLVLACAMGLSFVAGKATPAQAAEAQDFVIADDAGYGIADCMKPGMECGRVMADAFCQSHGRTAAAAFGLADDTAGSTKISLQSIQHTPGDAVVIRCQP